MKDRVGFPNGSFQNENYFCASYKELFDYAMLRFNQVAAKFSSGQLQRTELFYKKTIFCEIQTDLMKLMVLIFGVFVLAVIMSMVGRGGGNFYVPVIIVAGAGMHEAATTAQLIAGYLGADFLCYVTGKEHIGLPDIQDVREGVVVTKIAASIADVARGNKKAILQSKLMSQARENFDWDKMQKHAVDPVYFKQLVSQNPRLSKGGCSMCGDKFCALKFHPNSQDD